MRCADVLAPRTSRRRLRPGWSDSAEAKDPHRKEPWRRWRRQRAKPSRPRANGCTLHGWTALATSRPLLLPLHPRNAPTNKSSREPLVPHRQQWCRTSWGPKNCWTSPIAEISRQKLPLLLTYMIQHSQQTTHHQRCLRARTSARWHGRPPVSTHGS